MSYSLDSGDNATPNLELIKAKFWAYNTTTKRVEVENVDAKEVDYFYSIYNVTIGKMLYLINSENLTGVSNGNVLLYDNVESGIRIDDELIILYVKKELDTVKSLLKELILETKSVAIHQQITNLILSDSFATVLPNESDLK